MALVERVPPEDRLRWTPRTPLGAELLRLRRKIEAEGQANLSWQDIERERNERRGERAPDRG